MNYGVKLTVLLWAKTEQALPLKGWWYSERHVFRDSCFYVGGCHRGFRDALERWVSGMLLRRCLYSFSASCTCSKKYFASLGRILKNPHSSGRTMFTVFLFKGKKSIPGGVFFFFFFWLHLQHVDSSGSGIEPALQLWLAPQLWPCCILNPLCHTETSWKMC